MIERVREATSDQNWRLIAALGFLYIAGIIARYPTSMGLMQWNDVGYHMRISQLLIQKFPQHTFYDPNWRGGILMNYPTIFESIPAYLSVLTGIPIKELYPVVQLLVWALTPVALAYFVYQYTNIYGALIAGSIGVYPSTMPDQVSFIIATPLFFLATISFVNHLTQRRVRSGLIMGLGTALVFHSHLLAAQLMVYTWTVVAAVFIISYPMLGSEGLGTRFDQRLRLIIRLSMTTAPGVALYFLISAEWWYDTLTTYGLHFMDSPLANMTKEMAIGTSGIVPHLTMTYLPVFAAGLISLFIGISMRFYPALFEDQYISFRPKHDLAALCIIVLTGFSAVWFWGYNFNIWKGPVWRYYVFLVFTAAIGIGFVAGGIIELIPTREKRQVRFQEVAITAVIILSVISSGLLVGSGYSSGIDQKITNTNTPWPDSAGTPNQGGYEYLKTHANGSDTVLAGVPDSTWALAESNVTTVTGHYGTTNPNPQRDADAAKMIWSSNYTETARLLSSYNVDYIFVDEAHRTNGIFEGWVAHQKLWGGPGNGAELPISKYEYFGEQVYEDESVTIYRIDQKTLSEDENGRSLSLDNRNEWQFEQLGPVRHFTYRADGDLALKWYASPSRNEAFATRVLQNQVRAGSEGVLVRFAVNRSANVTPHVAVHYHEESSTRVAVGWSDEYYPYANTYHGTGNSTYYAYFPEVEGEVDVIKLGAVANDQTSSTEYMAYKNVTIYPVNSSSLSAQNDTSDARVAD
ncbi:hypothetical protein [Haloarcula pellucida]|uniref:hypothetical protein n=1 Tax=Haloarcula pellucida TaxID=1427151 RepID=UPI00166E7D55|nr:hypothetical protein [Halomicroarcula pellucida]MBX0348736.1 hypothetical protein [Halomicroarcula pellucida]